MSRSKGVGLLQYGLAAAALMISAPAMDAKAQVAPPPEMARAIPLGTGPVPESLGPEIWYGREGDLSVRNTVEAEIVPVLPAAGKATGASVVIAPGGAFMALAWEREGMQVAQALADRGVTAFVLKYRLKPTPREWAPFGKAISAQMADWIGKPGEGLRVVTPAYAVDDGLAALRLVRARAQQWGLDPAKVGMVGFSAGARTTIAVTLSGPTGERPAFIALLYPPMEAVTAPSDAPPAFIAMAVDDPLSGRAGFGLVSSWIAARRPVEFHAYQKGGHGFALGRPGTTTAAWMDGLLVWMGQNGFGAKTP
jgi:acetyl esterase/lipase